MRSHSTYFYFFFCPSGSLLLALVFCLSPSLSPSLSLTPSFSLLFRVEGTSEGSGWLSLLEADGRPKARRPQFHEAWFEHARTMSRGMPMDDGYMVCVDMCVCVWALMWGEMVNFVGYQSEEWDPKSQSVPACFFSLIICASLCAGWDDASMTFQWFGGFEAPYSWCPAAL